MLGEGTDGEEGDVDPRSFKNKSVMPRMAVSSSMLRKLTVKR